jgi:ABC-type anion transport system duplicated permease subunit
MGAAIMPISMRRLTALVLLAISAAAAADFVVVSQAYEVPLKELRLPGTATGTVTFRECKDCEYQTVRVTTGTQYRANGESLTLADFRKALESAPNPSDVAVTVLHHLESDTIQAIEVWF